MKWYIVFVICLMAAVACSEGMQEKREIHAKEMAIFWEGLQNDTCKEYPNPNCRNNNDSSPEWYLKEGNCYFEKEILTTPDYPYEWPHYDMMVYKDIYKCYFPGSNDEIAHHLWMDLNKFNLLEAYLQEKEGYSNPNQHILILLDGHRTDRKRLEPLIESCKDLMNDKSKKWLPLVCWPHVGGNWDSLRGWIDEDPELRNPDYKF